MTMLKKGTCSSSVTVSSKIYVCNGCGHTEMAKEQLGGKRRCSKCNSVLSIISSSGCENGDKQNNPSPSILH